MPPGFHRLANIGEDGEDRLVQELVAQPCAETLDEPVLAGLARSDIVPLDIPLLRAAQDRHTGQFGAIVADDRAGLCPYSGAFLSVPQSSSIPGVSMIAVTAHIAIMTDEHQARAKDFNAFRMAT